MKSTPWIHFKEDEDKAGMFVVHWSLAMILAGMSGYCQRNKIRFQVTSMVSTEAQDNRLGRIGNGHKERRAADLSVRGWSKREIEQFKNFWNNHEYNLYYGTPDPITKRPRLVLIHDSGHGNHAHIEVKYQSN